MVLSATAALGLTNDAIALVNAANLQQEVSNAESAIRLIANKGKAQVAFNATIVGNPMSNPMTATNLTALQQSFRDTFTGAGYTVALDTMTGFWLLTWGA